MTTVWAVPGFWVFAVMRSLLDLASVFDRFLPGRVLNGACRRHSSLCEMPGRDGGGEGDEGGHRAEDARHCHVYYFSILGVIVFMQPQRSDFPPQNGFKYSDRRVFYSFPLGTFVPLIAGIGRDNRSERSIKQIDARFDGYTRVALGHVFAGRG